MDSLQITYFKIVAQTLNISQAAKALYISQSSLSQTIRHLEKELGYPLFERNGRRISLNENGRIFLEFVKKTEAEYESVLTRMAEYNARYNQKVSIQIQCASLYLPQIMGHLKENLPEALFSVTQWNHDIQADTEADIQIFASSMLLEESNCVLLLEENILLALPQNHALLAKPEIFLEDLKEEKFISLHSSWWLEKMIAKQCADKGFLPVNSIQVDNPDILRRLLCQNMGLAFIPEKTWGIAFAGGMLELRGITDFTMRRYVYLKWKADYLSRNARKCSLLIQSFFEEHF